MFIVKILLYECTVHGAQFTVEEDFLRTSENLLTYYFSDKRDNLFIA